MGQPGQRNLPSLRHSLAHSETKFADALKMHAQLVAIIAVCITLFLKEMQLSLQVFSGTSQSDLNFSQTGATAATHEGHTHMLSHTATGTLRPPSSESFLQICLVLGLLFRSPISTAAGRVRSSGWGSLCAALVVISAPAATRALQSVNPNIFFFL